MKRPTMAASLQFFPERIDREYNPTAIVGFVEEPRLLVDSKLPERIFDELLSCTRIIISLLSIKVCDPCSRDCDAVRSLAVVEFGSMVFQKPALFRAPWSSLGG